MRTTSLLLLRRRSCSKNWRGVQGISRRCDEACVRDRAEERISMGEKEGDVVT
jgi:hypothetical protein